MQLTLGDTVAIADLPYLHAAGDGGPRSRTVVVVIHATDNTASAAAEAEYATTRPDQTSAHFYVDDTSAYRALPLDNIAYGCLWHGNQISVQLELCGRSNQLTDATMRRAAPIVAEICARYGLPVRKVGPADVAAGVRGICGHADITAAFPQDHGDHTDPGSAFPWSTFIGYVQDATQGGVDMDPDGHDIHPQLTNAVVLRDIWDAVVSGRPGGDDPVGRFRAPNGWKQITGAVAAATGSAPTQDQVNAAMLNALKDPAVLSALGAAVASHIHVS